MISQPCTCVTFIEECDSVVWNHESKGKYLVQSRYVVVSLRGFTPVYTPATWDINISHRVQITLVYNNLLTKDNLTKRRRAEDTTCLFCCEHKIVHHLFFSCCLAKNVWNHSGVPRAQNWN